jgi:hypothetical protein
MATVNDFTHTWPGITQPPLPPFRTTALSPEEEATFLRDEALSMLPGARAWVLMQDGPDEQAFNDCRPRMLYNMFSGHMPVLSMFTTGAQPEPIHNETDYWAYWKPFPAESPHPLEAEHWERVKAEWQLRRAHPALHAGTLELHAAQMDDPAVHVVLRRKDDDICVVALNFRHEPVTCQLTVDLLAIGIAPDSHFSPFDLLHDVCCPPCTGADLQQGYALSIPPRDGVVIKLQKVMA